MRLRREDDRLNLTGEMATDMETSKSTITMTSQPIAGISAEDLYGATLVITVNGTPSAFVTFTSVFTSTKAGMTAISASGLFMIAGDQTTTKAAYVSFIHMESRGVASEKALIYEIS